MNYDATGDPGAAAPDPARSPHRTRYCFMPGMPYNASVGEGALITTTTSTTGLVLAARVRAA